MKEVGVSFFTDLFCSLLIFQKKNRKIVLNNI